MWNTDPVIVVGVLVALVVNISLYSWLQAVLIRQLRANAQANAEVIGELSRELDEAQKNDARDPKTGRYTSLEDICVNPASYPPNR